MKVMDVVGQYWKAIVGFAAPAAVVITSAVQDGSVGGSHITVGEWVTAGCAAVITAGAVGAVKNRSRV